MQTQHYEVKRKNFTLNLPTHRKQSLLCLTGREEKQKINKIGDTWLVVA
jgi:hypothetical protein